MEHAAGDGDVCEGAAHEAFSAHQPSTQHNDNFMHYAVEEIAQPSTTPVGHLIAGQLGANSPVDAICQVN